MNSNPNGTTILLTAKEVAQTLAISPRKLWELTAEGEIPHVRLGRCVRYRLAAIEDYLATNERRGNER